MTSSEKNHQTNMNKTILDLLETVVADANDAGKSSDVGVRIVEVNENTIRVRSYSSERKREATVGLFSTHPHILSVHIDGLPKPALISADGWILNAILYTGP